MSTEQQYEKMPIVNSHAAGIDVGSKFHVVAIGQREEDTKTFGVYTEDLHECAKWLIFEGILTVAIESTGSYWQQLYIILQDYGLQVLLVNGKYTKNVKGKTDPKDSRRLLSVVEVWIQKLHSLGLLEGSFLPDNFTESVREYSRHRKSLIENASDYIKKMQKSLRLMNVRLDNVLRDVTGQSGQAIIKAILDGERDAKKLSELANYKVHASKEEIAKALTGDWRAEYIFELKQCYEFYQFFHQKISECDKEIEKLLTCEIERQATNQEKIIEDYEPEKRKKVNKNDPKIDLEKLSFQLGRGVDLMQIPSFGRNTLLTLISEIGFDLSKFPTVKHFDYAQCIAILFVAMSITKQQSIWR